jgi:DNA-binding GntR family transcriptional regulator
VSSVRDIADPGPTGTPRPRPNVRLDREGFVPLYFQLAEVLKERIEAGDWVAGDRFPSEREISEEFGVSRTVIRPALALLASDGQLFRIKGRGTFVRPPKTGFRIEGLTRLLADRRRAGVELRVVAAAPRRPDGTVRDVLRIQSDSDLVGHATVIVKRDGVPFSICDSFASPPHVPSLLDDLADRQVIPPDYRLPDPPRLASSNATVATAFVSEWEAAQLEIAAGDLCFLVRCVERAWVGRPEVALPIEFSRIVYRADAVELDLDLE